MYLTKYKKENIYAPVEHNILFLLSVIAYVMWCFESSFPIRQCRATLLLLLYISNVTDFMNVCVKLFNIETKETNNEYTGNIVELSGLFFYNVACSTYDPPLVF